MAGDTVLTIIGNLTADPELRFTPDGAAVANFTVASTPRGFDRNANEWKDGPALFMRCSIWRDAAENVAESLTRGSRVIVSGRLKPRSWTDAEGNKRNSVELEVDEIGPTLRYATAKITRTSSRNGSQTTTSPTDPAAASDRSGQLVGAGVGAQGGQDPWREPSGWGGASDTPGSEPGGCAGGRADRLVDCPT
ncbi:single-stranded DNA-binding protein [Nocardia sp. NPDC051321]|uniref:single-stranded DNA-binding protein n=1 Tax=Nocardia sp. NPDC051321 TaxID=3364323 RepID=UPI0037939A2F